MTLFAVLSECIRVIPQEPLLWLPILAMVYLLRLSANLWLCGKERRDRLLQQLGAQQLRELLMIAHLQLLLSGLLLYLISAQNIIHVLREAHVIE